MADRFKFWEKIEKESFIYMMYISIYVIYMVQAMINIKPHVNQVLNIVKAKHDLKDKSETINFVVQEYEEYFLEPELRPEYVKKLKNRL